MGGPFGVLIDTNIPIAGGSAADNTIEGHWNQFANGVVYSGGVVVTAMFPSTGVHSFFWSGYYTTEHRGTVTQASGRTIHTIDNRPAAEVYKKPRKAQSFRFGMYGAS
jgi:hypothetical protein